jgi:FkbM family methyltransferase
MASDYFESIGLPISGIIDRNARTIDPAAWPGVAIKKPDEVPPAAKADSLLAVCISTLPFGPISRALRGEDWLRVVPFYDIAEAYRDLHPLSNGWFGAPLTTRCQERVTRVFGSWADDVSRAHYLQFLAWRHLREEWSFGHAPVSTLERYWLPEIRQTLRSDEILVDVGAFDGRVTHNFLRLPEAGGARAIAIEGDPINLKRLNQNVALNPSLRGQIEVIDAVLSSHAEQITFASGLGYASQISPLGRLVVSAAPLDTLGLRPSIFKMHVEGAELDILEGAKETIQAMRPIIIATIYHDEKGSWELPTWFINSLHSYSFLFRLSGWLGTSALVYAVPNERRAATPLFS